MTAGRLPFSRPRNVRPASSSVPSVPPRRRSVGSASVAAESSSASTFVESAGSAAESSGSAESAGSISVGRLDCDGRLDCGGRLGRVFRFRRRLFGRTANEGQARQRASDNHQEDSCCSVHHALPVRSKENPIVSLNQPVCRWFRHRRGGGLYVLSPPHGRLRRYGLHSPVRCHKYQANMRYSPFALLGAAALAAGAVHAQDPATLDSDYDELQPLAAHRQISVALVDRLPQPPLQAAVPSTTRPPAAFSSSTWISWTPSASCFLASDVCRAGESHRTTLDEALVRGELAGRLRDIQPLTSAGNCSAWPTSSRCCRGGLDQFRLHRGRRDRS